MESGEGVANRAYMRNQPLNRVKNKSVVGPLALRFSAMVAWCN
jgi:hypothetical protein